MQLTHGGTTVQLCKDNEQAAYKHSCFERCVEDSPIAPHCKCDDLCMLYGDCCFDYEYHCVDGHKTNFTVTTATSLFPSSTNSSFEPSENPVKNLQYPTNVQDPRPTKLPDVSTTRAQHQYSTVTHDTSTSGSVLPIEDKVSTTLASAGNSYYKCNDSVDTDYIPPLETEEYWMKVMSRNVSLLSDLNCIHQSQFSNSYLLHDKCTINTPTSHLCNQSSSSSDPLSFVPVLGSDNVHYKNAYCALCSSLTYSDLQYWNLTLYNCKNLMESDAGNFATLNKKCKLEISFDSTNKKKPRVCVRSFLTKCFTQNKDTLIDACRKYSAPITIKDTLYKNPHCAECSGLNTSSIDSCERSGSGGIPGFGQSAGPSYHIFFDFGGSNAHYTGKDDQLTTINFPSCEEGATFDPFLGQCRQLSCPTGYEFIGDTCRALPKSLDYHFSTVWYFKMDFVLQYANISDSEVFSQQMLEILRNNVSVTHYDVLFDGDLKKIEYILSRTRNLRRSGN